MKASEKERRDEIKEQRINGEGEKRPTRNKGMRKRKKNRTKKLKEMQKVRVRTAGVVNTY